MARCDRAVAGSVGIRASSGAAALRAEGHVEPESAALAGLALEPQLAAHQFDDLPRKCQAKSGATITPIRPLIDLREWLENRRMERFGNADAGIFDAEAQADTRAAVSPSRSTATLTWPRSVNLTALPARLRSTRPEVVRIGFDPVGDAPDRARRRMPCLSWQRSASSASRTSLTFSDRSNGADFQLRGARAELGHVEQLVDFAQQLVGQGEDGIGTPGHRFVADLGRQQFGRRDDAGQRRAQFMADLGQQRRLGLAFPLGVLTRFAQAS